MSLRRSFLGASGTLVLVSGGAIVAGTASCSSEVRVFGAGGAGSSGTTGHGGAASSSSSTTTSVSSTASSSSGMSTGGAGGTGGAPPTVCSPGQPPYAGPLCGPAGAPCVTHLDEQVPSPASFRNDAPAIAVDDHCAPRVLFSVATGGYHGFYGIRDGGGWTATATPFDIASAGLVIPPGGAPLAVSYNGAFGTSLWAYGNGQWTSVDTVLGKKVFWSSGLGLDAQGVVHATFMTDNNLVVIGTHDTSWNLTPLVDTTSSPIPLAMSPTGKAQFSYWTSNGNGWHLAWAINPASPEHAAALGSNSLGVASHALAVTSPDAGNPDGVPYIFFARPQPGSLQATELAYATRKGPNLWSVASVDQESATNTYCNGLPPTSPGAVCNYDYDKLVPLAAVGSRGGDVRFLYAKNHSKGSVVAVCPGNPPVMCQWQPQSDLSSGQVFVASLDANNKVGTAPVTDKIMAASANAIVDTIGHIHLAVYDSFPPSQSGTTVRYLEIGP